MASNSNMLQSHCCNDSATSSSVASRPTCSPHQDRSCRPRTCVMSMGQDQLPQHFRPHSSCTRNTVLTGAYQLQPLLAEWSADGSARFNIQGYPLEALTAMNEFRQDGNMCDVVLQVQGEKFRVHKVVLAACSFYFRGMFTNGMLEADSDLVTIYEPSITAETMKSLIDFAYTQVIHVTQENVQLLLVSALFLEMNNVIDACTLFMEQQLDPSNCIGFAMFAKQHGCLDLEQKSIKFIEEHFCDVISHDEILTLGRHELLELISKDQLNVRCESEVFRAVVRWVKYDPDNRKCALETLLHNVRLSTLSPGFLVEQLRQCSLIKEVPQCEQMIVDRVSQLTSHRKCADRPRRTCKLQVIYVVGGFCRKTMESMNCFECYNYHTKEWNRLPDLPIARSLPGVAALKGAIYVLGGRLRKCGQDFDSCSVNVYDPIDNKWSTRCPMSKPRNRVGVGVLDNLIYAIGGRSGGELFKCAERYNTELDSWTAIANMRTVRMGAGIAIVNRLLFAVGGVDGANQRLQSVECYHPERNKWHDVASLNHPRSGAGVAVLNDYIYAVGGFDGVHQLQSMERYDVKNDAWHELTCMPQARSGIQLVAAGDKLYTLGGFDGTDFLSCMQSYDPESDSWHPEATMLCKRSGHGVTVSVAPEHLCS